MSEYINSTTLQYPIYQGDIRLEHPEIGEDFVCPSGYSEVFSTTPVFDEKTEVPYVASPIQDVSGVWWQQWAVRPPTQEELDSRPQAPE
jgi:hypothetical protein